MADQRTEYEEQRLERAGEYAKEAIAFNGKQL